MKKIIFLLAILACTSFSFSQNVYFYPIPTGTTNNLSFIFSASTTNHFISGANGTFLRSTDAGLTSWNPITLGTSANLNGIMLKNNLSSAVQCVFGQGGVLYQSTNNGVNWAAQTSNTTSNLNAGTVVLGDSAQAYKYMIVGDNGTIIYKYVVPGTGNWISLAGVTTNNLKTIYSSGKYVWAGGPNGFIMKSSNSGMNWTQLVSGTMSDINSICFRTPYLGFAVGNGGLILKTTNGGANWFQLSGGTVQNLNQVLNSGTVADTNSFWIAGNAGVVLRTINAGAAWLNDPYVPNVNFTSGTYTGNNLYVVGELGKLYKRSIDTSYHYMNYAFLNSSNISSIFTRWGIFDQDIRLTNMPGFEWPNGSGKHAIFTAGLTIGAYVNNELRMASCSYKGEYTPGFCVNGNFYTDTNKFKHYKYTRGVDTRSSYDWIYWGLMVPYGAPYIDVNNNGIYEYMIDTPGVRYAKSTLFICLTDADTNSHNAGEGFGGGTKPLGCELHMTAWEYDSPAFLQNVQFISFDYTNKSPYTWYRVKTGITSDPDLGGAEDDYIGCDTALHLGYCYNGDNSDVIYGANPPAVGFEILRGHLNRSITPNVRLNMTSFTKFTCNGCPNNPPCESDPNGQPLGAYRMLSGLKKDSTSWLNPTYNPPKKTKFIHSGDPETNTGWNEAQGVILNCNLDSTGTIIYIGSGDRRLLVGSGAENFSIVPGESQKFVIAQLIVRGNSNLNSVTRLKQLADSVRIFYEGIFPIGINQISNNIPESFTLFQNYPNPFNPVTNIKYQIAKNSFVTLKVYDILGREVETLVSEIQQAGVYETQFPGNTNASLASGIYFYKIIAGDFTAVKRMVLIK